MKRPSFQFYPADWRNNAKLRRCSESARGAWMDVLCVLHDSDEYGVLRWPLADVARAAGVPLRLLRELATKDVLKGADTGATAYIYTPRHAGQDGAPVTLVEPRDGPCWYCSRLVRDEWVRQRRGKGTQFTDKNQPPNLTPKPTFGDGSGDGPTSTSTSTSKSNTPLPPEGGKARPGPKAKKAGAVALQTFLDECKAQGERPLRDYAPLWAYVDSAGLDRDFVALAWVEFCRRFLPGGTGEGRRYKNWRIAFRDHIEKGYLKLWAIDKDGTYFLTSLGKQAQKVHQQKEAA